MVNIYQLFPRLFGNKVVSSRINGTIHTNGCGKFDDISDVALLAIKEMGITHIWLTGILRHATLTDYSAHGIPKSHPSVVKGLAGSPYAINDYYDVDPDLAVVVSQRMSEFEALIGRIHNHGMKVLMDFVPNHLAREYASVGKPATASDFGFNDQVQLAFHPNNNFYYIQNQSFWPPYRESDLYQNDKVYIEQPAKATGNDCFNAMPSINDWFETVKLNYGIDYQNDQQTHFDPVPDTWFKMEDILKFWLKKGVDGFRSDMAEMVPVPFWKWVIDKIRLPFPDTIMIAEIYRPGLYPEFVQAGFDYLYDKVCLYNRLHDVLLHGHAAESLSSCWKMLEGLNHKMLRFMENHDEPRLASPRFFGDAHAALPAVALSAFMHNSAFMIYNGQESGEEALGITGFSGDDGRSSIFDYCAMPQHQRWMNNGRFDESLLSYDQLKLRKAYRKILTMRLQEKALRDGDFYDLMWANPWYTEFDPRFVYAFLRYTVQQQLLVVINFHRFESRTMRVNMHPDAFQKMGIMYESDEIWTASDLITDSDPVLFRPKDLPEEGIRLTLKPSQYAVYQLNKLPINDD